jgi:translocation and assembly module TamA
MTSRPARTSRVVSRVTGWLAPALLCLVFPAYAADRIRIEVDGVDRQIADNVRSYLSLARYTQREDLTDAQVRRLADRAVDETTDALRPFGYYEPNVRSRTTRDDENWIVRLRITPGEPVRVAAVDIVVQGDGSEDRPLLQVIEDSSVREGARLEHPAYEGLKTSLLRTAQERGYLDAQITRRELVVDPANRRADVHLTLETGGRYRFGKVEVEQNAINPALMQSFLRFKEGDLFLAEQIRNSQFALEDSSYFETVTVTTGDRDKEALTVPVTVHGERIGRNRYTVSAGYGTDTGVRGKLTWDNRLVNTRGHRMQFQLTASAIKQEAITRYIIPVGDPSLEKVEFSLGYINEELGDLDSERFEQVNSYTEVLGRWQRVLFIKVNRETTGFPDGSSQTDLIFIPGVSYASLPPNFLTGWVRDAAYYFELSGSPETLGSDASYVRFYGRGEKVWPIKGPYWLRLRGEVGASWVNEFSELPASQRFFAGGDRSVRGYALNELSPREVDPNDPEAGEKTVGGENKLVGSIEIERDFPRNFRGAIFLDTGNAFNDWADQRLVYSAGIGVRFKLPMIMLGLDIAQSLSDSDKNPRFHLNITQVL